MPTIDDVEASDKPFVEVLLYDLRECIHDADWTYNLWLELFADHYGWEPETLVEKYDDVLREEVPGYAAKVQTDGDTADTGLTLEDFDSIKPWHREQFHVVLRDLRAWDWSDPFTTYQAWLESYTTKHSKSPGVIMTPYGHLLKKLVPAFEERMRLNKTGGIKKARHAANAAAASADDDAPAKSTNGASPSEPVYPSGPVYPDLPEGVSGYSGIRQEHQGLFHMIVTDLNSRDWVGDPNATKRIWAEGFRKKTGYATKQMFKLYASQLKQHCPGFTRRVMLNNKGNRNSADHRAALHRPSWLPPPPQRSPSQIHREVEPSHQALFNLVVSDVRAHNWTAAGVTQAQFIQEFKTKSPDLIMIKYSQLLRRLCPAYAERMDINRGKRGRDSMRSSTRATPVTLEENQGPAQHKRQRQRISVSSRSTDSDIEVLPSFPHDEGTLGSSPDAEEPLPRPAFRPRRPMAFPAALASLEIEAYRAQSGEALVPKLADFGTFITTRAVAEYQRFVDRAEELLPLIAAKENELRPMAEAIDNVHAAIQHIWDELDNEMATFANNSGAGVSPERAQATQALYDRQDQLTSRRAVLSGRRLELDKLRAERDKCLRRARHMDELVVGAQARLEAVFMSDDDDEAEA